jgi:hypothetical protein
MLKSKFNLLNLYLIVLASRRFIFSLERKTSHNSALSVSALVIRTTGCNTMRLTTLAVATPLVLVIASGAAAATAFGNHGSLGSNQFVHVAFGQHVHKRPHNRFVLPYPYYDYDYPADAFGEPPTYPPPVVTSVPPAPPPPCQRSVEKFTVPSQDGGTKQITIINCP